MSEKEDSSVVTELSSRTRLGAVRKPLLRVSTGATQGAESSDADHALLENSGIDANESPASEHPVFPFEIDLETVSSIPVLEGVAIIRARFRHFHSSAINLQHRLEGALNLGVRLYRVGSHDLLFESRMAVDDFPIAPDIWISASVKIPVGSINFADRFVLVADLVKEKEYWFATKGMPDFRADVTFTDGTKSQSSQRDSHAVGTLSPMPPKASSEESPKTDNLSPKLSLVFDVSDLVQYFQNARLPTGIQRVQIELITNLIFSIPSDCSLKVACFTKQTDMWIDVPVLFFNHICKLAVVNGDPLAPEWLRVLEELKMNLEHGKNLVFSQGAFLINLGTSWCLQNYFLHVRAAKARYGIRYVPYVHDCIPIITPEHCVESLTRDFIAWALGAFQHADHIIVNSNATSRDVKAVAAKLGHSMLEEPKVVALDGDYRAANACLPPRNEHVCGHGDIPKKMIFAPESMYFLCRRSNLEKII